MLFGTEFYRLVYLAKSRLHEYMAPLVALTLCDKILLPITSLEVIQASSFGPAPTLVLCG